MILLWVVLQTVFVCCFALVAYVYVGFPLALVLLTRGRRRASPPELPESELPSVSFVVAAYNEEPIIEQKLKNSLLIDYPAERLQLIFVSDGSTDRTNQILRGYETKQVKVCILPSRRGKVLALHRAFQLCSGEILVFSDANTFYRPDAIRKLVRHFADARVGLVTGDVRILRSACTFGEGEGLYYRYERTLQLLESALGSTVAIDGAMYALRRPLLRPASQGGVPDDLVTAMNVGVQGFRMLYDPEAIAEENPTPDDRQEFQRKVRVVAQGIQAAITREGVPGWRQTQFLWTYLSHKVLRWLAPVFLIGAFVSSVALSRVSNFWEFVAIVQVVFYLLAMAAWRFPQFNGKLFRTPYYFSMVNLAALLGVIRGLRRAQQPVWTRTERTSV
jgi:biofilm PGA synthesis N-glycosyltransferase PgaC